MRPSRLPLTLFALLAVTLSAQQTHHATTATHRRPRAVPCPAAETVPALPAGIPPATGKVESAFALRYIDIKPGDGAEAQPNLPYTVHYTGWLASDGTKFDSSVDRGQPFTFLQGAHSVISGWDNGFSGMRVGGKRRLFIPYQLAYGERGRPPVIPPKSDLIFDIELISAGDTPPQPPEPAEPPPSAQPPQPSQAPQSATPPQPK